MSYDRKLMETLTQCFAPSGCEYYLCKLIEDELREYADEMRVDAIGNLIVRKTGRGERILLSAHMDQPGMMISYIADNGNLYFSCNSTEKFEVCSGRKVIFPTGLRGTLCGDDAEKTEDMYIDIGADSREKAEEQVSVGDYCVYDTEYFEDEDCAFGRAMDDRSGCYALVKAFKQLKNPKYDVYFAFTVQNIMGTLGARTVGYWVQPDIGISVDVVDADDLPCGSRSCGLESSVVITLKNGYTVFASEISSLLENTAQKNKIKYVKYVGNAGFTDASEFQVTRGGIKVGAISIPVRYMHIGTEVVSKKCVEETIKLITALLNREKGLT